jgi:hypothetical protein
MTVSANPASLPPMVIVTRSVRLLRCGTCQVRTSPVLAPPQATIRYDAGSLRSAHYVV